MWRPLGNCGDTIPNSGEFRSCRHNFLKRIFDLFLALCLVPVLSVPILVIAVLVRLTSKGPALYWSDRVGVGNGIFKMPKFRTMRIDTPAVATHLIQNPDEYLTPIGPFLRKSSLDELPQGLGGSWIVTGRLAGESAEKACIPGPSRSPCPGPVG